MKTIILLLIIISGTLQAQTSSFDQTSDIQLNYIKSHINELADNVGNKINVSVEIDSIIFHGQSSNNHFGSSVSSAGDVNGDGYSDIIVGAYGYNSNTGRAYIFYGGLTMDNIADVILTGESLSNSFGRSVSCAGDVNADGYSDVVVGAYEYYYRTGKSYVFYGGKYMDNVADVTMTGESITSNFGVSVSGAGDVNNDGYSDLIIGAYEYNGIGRAYVYLGGSSMNNVADIIMTGESGNDEFGYSVSEAGDVNGDGFSDVIIGAYNYASLGATYIFFGGTNMNNSADVIMTGSSDTYYFGYSVSNAGDLNKDGYSDVIVGTLHSLGNAYIYYGGASMNNIKDVTLTGESADNFFGSSVSTAGDLNGDGFSDVIVGAYGFNLNTGRAYIFYGSPIMDNVSDVKMTGESINNYFGSVTDAGDVNGDGNPDIILGANGFNSGTGIAYVYINLMQKPRLINPLNYSVGNPVSLNFKWRKVNSAINYILSISLDSLFNNVVIYDTISIDTFTTIAGLIKDKKYYWRVIAKDSLGVTYTSSVWNFTTIPPIYLNLKVLMEGLYYQFFNQMIRKDTVNVYLRNATLPYAIIDSAKGIIDSLSFSNIFSFINAPSGTYYIVVKHFNSIETWSKAGGESMTTNGSIYSYDFTTSVLKAYGNNLKLKGGKYCIYGGNVNGDAIVDASDLSDVDNDSYAGLSGMYLRSDVNGDGFVDASDITMVDNNRSVVINRPYF
jgi:hypothetical protein